MKVTPVFLPALKNHFEIKKFKKELNINNPNNNTNISNYYYPVSFCGNIYTVAQEFDKPEYKKQKEEAIAKEKKLSKIARDNGVNTPEISDRNTYVIQGEIADFSSNPVNNTQLAKTLDNIFLMDKAGLFHGDLEIGHIFYSPKANNPEFDCFRAGYEFSKEPGRNEWEFPKTMYPTNLYQFENNWIGCYISKMPENKKDEFLKSYLQISSDFHQNKANFLKETEDATEAQIEFETLQAQLYKNPAPELIELFKDRVNFQYFERLAFTETDEGQGACGHKPNESRVIKGNLMYFDTLKLALKYIDKIKNIKSSANGDMYKLLDYIESYGDHQVNNLLNANIGRALWSVNLDNPQNVKHRGDCKAEKENFEKLYNKLHQAHNNGNRSLEYLLIDETQSAYKKMTDKAKVDNNVEILQ